MNKKKRYQLFTLGVIIGLSISATAIYAATSIYSVNVTYDNTSSSLSSSTVQDAIDELYGMCLVKTKISSYITKLFNSATKTSVTTAGSESIVQSSNVNLMLDSYGNVRYYGANPDNYVSFNDELWRIIGVFDVEDEDGNVERRVKIVRNESLIASTFDNRLIYTTSEVVTGSNDWSKARLMMLLNPGYEDGLTGLYEYEGSLYWNSKSGTCYYPTYSDETGNCDFTSTGLSDTSKNLIGQAVYYLGGSSSYSSLYADDYYSFERGTNVYPDNETEWTGYIGLIYPSDYVYAADLSVCKYTGYQYNYDETNCRGTDWLYTGSEMWTISPNSSDSYYLYNINSNGSIDNYDNGAMYEYDIFPVAYLNADVTVSGGSGTENNPYTIE